MNYKTKRALEGSINKWKKIVLGKGIDKGPDNCPLCTQFYGDDCIRCPVNDNGQKDGCVDTPYQEWFHHHRIVHPDGDVINDAATTVTVSTQKDFKIKCEKCLSIALDELLFLILLREKNE